MKLAMFQSPLPRIQRWMRAALVVATWLVALALRAVDPATLSWLPIHTSCGAVTGLPCIFCGTTRAMHHLLHGHFAQALYFNWLAFPVAAIAIALVARAISESILGRSLSFGLPAFHLRTRTALMGAVALVLLWTFQVSLALAYQKHELLNRNGLLYGLLVR